MRQDAYYGYPISIRLITDKHIKAGYFLSQSMKESGEEECARRSVSLAASGEEAGIKLHRLQGSLLVKLLSERGRNCRFACTSHAIELKDAHAARMLSPSSDVTYSRRSLHVAGW